MFACDSLQMNAIQKRIDAEWRAARERVLRPEPAPRRRCDIGDWEPQTRGLPIRGLISASLPR